MLKFSQKKSLFITFSIMIAVQLCAAFPSVIDLEKTAKAEVRNERKEKIIFEKNFGPQYKWHHHNYIHGGVPARDRAAIMALGTAEFTSQGAILTTNAKLRNFRNKSGKPVFFSNNLTFSYPIKKELWGKNLKFTFPVTGSGELELYLVFQGPRGDKSFKSKGITVRSNAGKGEHSISSKVPENAVKAVLLCRIFGVGKIAVKSVKLSLVSEQSDFDVLENCMGYLDEEFHIPEKTAFPLAFMVRRNQSKKIGHTELVLELPEGLELLDSDKRIPLIEMDNNICRFDFTSAVAEAASADFYMWKVYQIFVTSKKAVDSKPSIIRYYLKAGNKTSKVRKLSIHTVKKFKAASPKRYHSFLEPVYWFGMYSTQVAEAMAKLMVDSGFVMASGSGSKEWRTQMRKNNLKYTSHIWEIRNGHVKGKNPAFLGIDGKPYGGLLCPEEVIRRGPAYVNGALKKITASYEKSKFNFNYVNWEVYGYDYKGCFCNTCKEAFIRFSKLPAKKVNAAWPRKIVSTWHDTWCKFRSYQHGKLCQVIEEDMCALGKKHGQELHFMPQLSYVVFDKNFGAQYSPRDYFKYMTWVNLWGPYSPSMGLRRPYTYRPGRYLEHYFSTEELMRNVRQLAPQLKVSGLPYGSHANQINLPEAVVMETLSCFVNGYHGSGIYWFDFDYRYWKAMAEANHAIATYENMVFDGKPFKNFSVKAAFPVLTAKYILPHFTDFKRYPGLKSAQDCIQSKAWKKDGSILVAAGNFWEKAGAFIRLTVPELSGKYLIRQPHSNQFMRTTGKELAKGVLLHLPPLAWDFYLITPDDGNVSGIELTQDKIAKKMAGSRKKTEMVIQEEERLLKELLSISSFENWNFAASPEISVDGVTVREFSSSPQVIDIKAKNYQAKLQPSAGGGLTGLSVNGRELISQKTVIGRTAFLRPVDRILSEGLRVIEISAVRDHVKVVLERPSWNKMKVLITWKFYPGHIQETVSVKNVSQENIKVFYRFHNMLKMLGGSNGDTVFAIGSKRLSSKPENRFYLIGNTHPEVPSFAKKALRTSPGTVDFNAVKFDFSKSICGFFFWNTPAAGSGSFEPLFKETFLKPGEVAEFKQIIRTK